MISGTMLPEHRADIACTSKDPLHHMWKKYKLADPWHRIFGQSGKSDVLGRGLGWEADQDHVRRWPKDAISLAFFPFLPPAHRATESLTLCCRVCRGNKIAAQKNSEKVVLSNEGLQELPPTIAQLRACKVSHRCGETERETSPGGGTAHWLSWVSGSVFFTFFCFVFSSFHFAHLYQHLDVSYNEIPSVPAEIGKILNLRVLNLQHNRLKSLPGQIAYLKNLQELDLSQNKLFIYGFPAPVLQCKALVKLSVADNQLDDLPDNLYELSELRELDVSNNMIKVFPPDLGKMIGLSHLVMAGCKVQALPPEIGDMRGLTYLDVSSNELTKLPAQLGLLSQLVRLLRTETQPPLLISPLFILR